MMAKSADRVALPLVTLLGLLMVATVNAGARPVKGKERDLGGPAGAFLQRSLQGKRLPARGMHMASSRTALSVPAPLRENFESGLFPPAGWTVVNPDPLSITWEFATGVSGYGNGSGSAWMDFYSYEFSPGHLDDLRTPVITGLTASDSLIFDYAYAEYDDPFFGPDSLLIRLSIDGGTTFPLTIYADGGATLATASPTTLPFTPLASDWSTVRLSLPPSVAGSSVVIAFTGVNGYSNNLYVDNVFAGSVPANDIQAFGVLSPAADSKQRTSFAPEGIVRNAGTAGQTLIPVRFQVLSPAGSLLYNSPRTISALAAGQADTVVFPAFSVPSSPGTYETRLITQNSGDANPENDTVISRFFRPGVLSGIITVGTGGMLTSLRAAVDTLNRSDVVGPLAFRLTNPVYNEAGPLTISAVEGAGPSSGVTFLPAPGLAVTVNVPGTPEAPYALALRGSSFITIDGGDPPSSLTIAATGADGAAALYVAGMSGRPSGHNTVRNLVLRTAADSTASSAGFYGILFAGYDEVQKDSGNTVMGCRITRHGQAGIAAQNTHGLLVESCTIRDWVQQGGFSDVRGIWLATGATQSVLRGNTIGNIRNTVNGWWAFGIHNEAGAGSSLLCSSNSVWGIGSSGSGSEPNVAAGIVSSSALNSGDHYYHNSVFLYGSENSASGGSRSAAFEFAFPASSGLRVRNNIGVNITQHLGGGAASRGYAVFHPVSSWPVQDTCDRNDWWTPGPSGAVGYINGVVRTTLADWRAAAGQDATSISADPRFVTAADLHVALGSSPAGNSAVPLAGETEDIDGDSRSLSTPDIGCDEFSANHITVPVSVREGWNMISNPVVNQAGQDSVRRLYPDAMFPYAFSFSPSSGYEQKAVLEKGKGYWEKFRSAGTQFPSGDMRLLDTLEVQAGWNMIGSISVPLDTGMVVALPSGLRASAWFSYAGSYAAADTLLPGSAYWVKAAIQGRFVFAGPPPTKPGEISPHADSRIR